MSSSMPFSSSEYLDRVKYEFDIMISQLSMTKIENERLKGEKEELVHQANKNFEMAYFLNVSNHRLSEINSRLASTLQRVLSLLPDERRESFQSEINQISKVSIADIERRIRSKQTVEGSEPSPNGQESFLATASPQTMAPVPVQVMGSASSSIHKMQPKTPTTPIKTHHSAQNNSFTKLSMSASLQTGHAVSSLCLNKTCSRMYVGGKGSVKIVDSPLKQANNDEISNHYSLDFTHESFIRSMTLSSDETTMYACGEGSGIVSYDVVKGLKKLTLPTPDSSINFSMTCSKDDRLLMWCQVNGLIGLWDCRTNDVVRKFEGHSETPLSIEMDPIVESRFFTAGMDKTLKIWDITTGRTVQEYRSEARILSTCASPLTDSIVLGLENGCLEVVGNTRTQLRQISIQQKHFNSILTSKFSPKGNYYVSGGKDCFLKINRATMNPAQKDVSPDKLSNSVLSCDVACLHDTDCIAVGTWDKKVHVYSLCNF